MVNHVKTRTRSAHPSKQPAFGLERFSLREQRAVARVQTELRALLPNGELKSLVLYGSKPRGEARRYSDIDLFLVYDDVTLEQENALEEYASDLFDRRPFVHLFLYRADELAKHNGVSPLIYNVAHTGITLEGTPVPKFDIDRPKVAAKFLADAQENIRIALILIEANAYRNAISCSFYAALYAADAAFATKGFVTHSHEGTETLFGFHFLKPQLVDAKFRGLLKRIRDARIKADYKHDVTWTRDDAEYWYERAREFVSTIDAALPQWLEE